MELNSAVEIGPMMTVLDDLGDRNVDLRVFFFLVLGVVTVDYASSRSSMASQDCG
jgi:hypothetical protein